MPQLKKLYQESKQAIKAVESKPELYSQSTLDKKRKWLEDYHCDLKGSFQVDKTKCPRCQSHLRSDGKNIWCTFVMCNYLIIKAPAFIKKDLVKRIH